MKAPKPRTTQIIKSGTIKGLFYEGFKGKSSRKKFNNDDLIIAFHYRGKRFDLNEFVRIKPGISNISFRDEGDGFTGRIVAIEPDSENGKQKLILRIDDCESEEQDLFEVTEIEKLEG